MSSEYAQPEQLMGNTNLSQIFIGLPEPQQRKNFYKTSQSKPRNRDQKLTFKGSAEDLSAVYYQHHLIWEKIEEREIYKNLSPSPYAEGEITRLCEKDNT